MESLLKCVSTQAVANNKDLRQGEKGMIVDVAFKQKSCYECRNRYTWRNNLIYN